VFTDEVYAPRRAANYAGSGAKPAREIRGEFLRDRAVLGAHAWVSSVNKTQYFHRCWRALENFAMRGLRHAARVV
jgi:hypothetical protein